MSFFCEGLLSLMFEIRPFRALRFDSEKISSFDDVITPPFDVINPEQRAALAARSAHNMVHVILPEDAPQGKDKYSAARDSYRSWLDAGVLRVDDAPSYYALEQRFPDMDGKERVRRVLYGLAKIPEPGERLVLGHEKTFRYKIEDRLALLQASRIQPGAIFVLYPDPDGAMQAAVRDASTGTPITEASTIDGVTQRFWRVSPTPAIAQFFAGGLAYIGDGHHRFATSQAYRDECRAAGVAGDGHEYVMFGFVAFEDPGLLVYPAHRLVAKDQTPPFSEIESKLSERFSFERVEGDLIAAFNRAGNMTFGLAMGSGERYLVKLKEVNLAEFLGEDHGPAWRDLDVSVLHRGIFEGLLGLDADTEMAYEPDPARAMARCASGACGMGWFMKPATPGQIRACADAGEFMPQKATYLFPKLPTGGVMYSLDGS